MGRRKKNKKKNANALPSAPPNWRNRALQLAKIGVPLVIGAVLSWWIPKLFEDKPHVVAYYLGGGQRLGGAGQHAVEVKRSEPSPQQVPYWIGPFEIKNEGTAITGKNPVASLGCSSPFQAYADPLLAPGEPRLIWRPTADTLPMIHPGRSAVYRYMRDISLLGPGDSAVLFGFALNPSEREVRCELIVTSGAKKPTTLDLLFKFKDWSGLSSSPPPATEAAR